MQIELEQLTGPHLLSAAFFDSVTEETTWGGGKEEKQVLRFTLDNKHYEAVEDPEDGYRSCLGDLRLTETAPKTSFAPCAVTGVMKTTREWSKGCFESCDLLQFITESGKVVMEIGTSNTDDYYPGYVAEFHLENL